MSFLRMYRPTNDPEGAAVGDLPILQNAETIENANAGIRLHPASLDAKLLPSLCAAYRTRTLYQVLENRRLS